MGLKGHRFILLKVNETFGGFIFQISFRPASVGRVETRLVAATNAGDFEVRLIVEGVE